MLLFPSLVIFFATWKSVFGDEKRYTALESLEYSSFEVRYLENKYYSYTPRNPSNDVYLYFTDFQNPSFDELRICIYYDKEKFFCDSSKKIYSASGFKVGSNKKKYFFILSCNFWTSVSQTLVFYESTPMTPISYGNPIQLPEYSSTSKLYYSFSFGVNDLVSIKISKKNSGYTLRYRVINRGNFKLVRTAEEEGDVNIILNDLSMEASTYFLEISSNNTSPITEMNTLIATKNSYSFLTLTEGEKLRSKVNYSQSFFFYKLSTKALNPDEGILITLGFDQPGIQNSFTSFYIQCISKATNESFCSNYYQESEDPTHHFVLLKNPTQKPLTDIIIVTAFELEQTPTEEIEYSAYAHRIDEEFDIDSIKSLKQTIQPFMPYLIKVVVPSSYEETLNIYSPNSKGFQIVRASSMAYFFDPSVHSDWLKLYSFSNFEYPEQPKVSCFYIYLYAKENTEVSLYLKSEKSKRINFISNSYFLNSLVHLYDCFRDNFFAFQTYKDNKQYILIKSLDQVEAKIKTEFEVKDGEVEIFQTSIKDNLEVNTIHKLTDIVLFKVNCRKPTEVNFIFFEEESTTLDEFGKRYLHFSEKGEINFIFYGQDTDVLVENLGGQSITVSFSDKDEVIEPHSSRVFCHNTQDVMKYYLNTEGDGFVAFTLKVKSTNFFNLNKELEWVNQTFSKSIEPRTRGVIYNLPSSLYDDWVYLEVRVNTDEFDNYFGNQSHSQNENGHYNIHSLDYNTNKSSYVMYYFNHYLFGKGKDNEEYFFSLVSQTSNIREIQLIYHNDFDIFGKTAELPYFTLRSSEGPKKIVGLQKVSLAFMCQSCSVFDSPYFMVASENKTSSVVLDSYYSLIEYENPDFPMTQTGLKNPLSTSGFQGQYTGAFCSYKPYASRVDFEKLKEYQEISSKISKTKPRYNRETGIWAWEKINDYVEYEIIFFDESIERPQNLTNRCQLYEMISDKKYTVNKTTFNYFFSRVSSPKLGVITALIQNPIPLRIVYPIAFGYQWNSESVYTAFPQLRKVDAYSEVLSSELNSEKKSYWDYIEIIIHDPIEKYYIGLDTTTDYNNLVVPFRSPLSVKEGHQTFILQNPYLSLPENESTKYYFNVRFSKGQDPDAGTSNCKIEYSYKKGGDFPELNLTEGGYYANETFFSGETFRVKNVTRASEPNEVNFLAKKCDVKSSLDITAMSYEKELKSFSIGEEYKMYNFETYTDVFLKFNLNNQKNSSFMMHFLDPKEGLNGKRKIELMLENRVSKIENSTKEIHWTPLDIDEEVTYEVYIFEETKDNKDLIENLGNECYFHRNITLEKGFINKATTNETFLNVYSYNDVHINVLAKISKPAPLQILYQPIHYENPDKGKRKNFLLIVLIISCSLTLLALISIFLVCACRKRKNSPSKERASLLDISQGESGQIN